MDLLFYWNAEITKKSLILDLYQKIGLLTFNGYFNFRLFEYSL